MIDFFGRKAKRERDEARRSCEMFARDLKEADDRIRELADIIRENDQLVYNISQLTTREEQRPHFNKLQVGQESRMRAESNRIGSILRTELLEVYGGKLSPEQKRLAEQK